MFIEKKVKRLKVPWKRKPNKFMKPSVKIRLNPEKK